MSETFVKRKVCNCEKLNVREKPSSTSKVICTLNDGDIIHVSSTYSKTVNGTTWLKIKSNDKRYYVSSKYVREIINFQEKVADSADRIYKEIIDLGCKHEYGALNESQLKSKKIVTCVTSSSIALQSGGVLGSGKLVGHTEKVSDESKKDTIKGTITGIENLKDGTYTVHRVNKLYKDMASSLKERGTEYIWNSNIGISAGNGYIYSCNNASSELKNGKYVKNKVNSGYCFDHKILYAITWNKEY